MSHTPGPKELQRRALREADYAAQQARQRQQRLLPDPERMKAAKEALAAPVAALSKPRRKK